MKNLKRILALLICMVMVIGIVPAMSVGAAETEIYSGTCGDDLTWNLENGVLTISGTGAMTDWSSASDVPWYNLISAIESVAVEDGVTTIGSRAFSGCTSLSGANISDSVVSIGDYAFSGCTAMTDTSNLNGVVNIGQSAFGSCKKLQSVSFGDSAEGMVIGDTAFFYCSSLTSVEIPEGAESVGDSAFYYCSSLSSVTVPDSVMSIGRYAFSGTAYYSDSSNWENDILYIDNWAIYAKGSGEVFEAKNGTVGIADYAFYNCTALTKAELPETMKSIGAYAFYGCTGLTDVNIPEGASKIGAYAFYKCAELVNAEIPNTVTKIGASAFYGCTALTSANIPEGVEAIESSTFYGCTALTSVVIPNSVTAIGSSAFSGCTNLAEIDFPSNVESVERNVFSNTAYYNDESNWENGALYIGNWLIDAKSSAAAGDIAVKSGTIGIVPYAFYSCSALTKITIPDSVKFLGDHAFASCTGLTSAVIGSSVTSIGEEAFYKCTHLTSVTIGSSVESIEDEAFRGASRLTEVIIPDNVTHIGYAAFYQCSSMKTLSIGEHVTEIEMYAFDYCSSLTSVVLPDGVARIPQNLFSNCTKLAEVQLGNNVTYIGYEAFYNCTSLTNIEIPDTVTEIGYYAFQYCSALTSITLPDSVEAIHKYAFMGTAYYKDESNWDEDGLLYLGNWLIRADSAVEDVEIKYGTIGIADYTFSGCDSMSSVKIPESVIYIGNYSFEGRSSIESLEIPGSVKIIGWYAFSGCSGLRNVNIAYGVTEIGQYAFNGCSVLYNVEIPDSVTTIGSGAFTSTPTWMRVYYLNSQEKWQEIDGWDTTKITGTIYYGISGISVEKYEAESCVDEFDSLYVGDSIKLTVEVMVENGTALSFEKGNWTCDDADAVEFGTLSASGAVVMENNDNYSIYTVSMTAELDAAGEFEIEFNSPNGVSSSVYITARLFEPNKYRANYLFTSPDGEVMEAEFAADTPSKILRQVGKENGLDGSTGVWEIMKKSYEMSDNPTKVLDYVFEEKDIYEAIIMSALETSVDYKVMGYINNDVVKMAKKISSAVTGEMKSIYSFEVLDDLGKLTDYQKSLMSKSLLSSLFKDHYPEAAKLAKWTKFVGDVIDYGKDFQTVCETVSSYYYVSQLNDSMKEILQSMYDECGSENSALKEALEDCITVMNASEDEFYEFIDNYTIFVVGKDGVQLIFDELWDVVKKVFTVSHPGAALAKAAYKAGTFVSNVCYNTDETLEKYAKIVALVDTWELIESVYDEKKAAFIDEDTEESAEVYNTAIDIMYNMLNTDCEYASSFASAVDDSLSGKVFDAFGLSSTQAVIKSVENMQNTYYLNHESVLTSWVDQLEVDYPEEYENYSSLIDESAECIVKKYSVDCPVDIYVYDKEGVLAASVVDNTPYCADGAIITVGAVNDSKIIYLYGDKYDIVYVGTDTGTMNIEIEEYSSAGITEREVYFNNIPLTDGQVYTSSEPGENSVSDAYTLMSGTAETKADYDSLSDSGNTYTAEINRGYFTADMSASLELCQGQNAEISAYIPDGYEFVTWESDAAEDIFTDSESAVTTIIMPDCDVNITAVLKSCYEIEITSAKNGCITVSSNCANLSDASIYIAVYNTDGTLKSAVKTSAAESVTVQNINFEIGDVIKAMLWKENLQPLTSWAEMTVKE